jgi:hypothetical protein
MSWLHVVCRKYVSVRHQHNCNVWGAKSDMLHDYAQLTHTNPYEPLLVYPYHF